MAREICGRCSVPLHETVTETLCCGGDELAVDGVLLVGEHGDYPRNEFEQILYPRKELFDKIVDVFRSVGQSVPVFCDKHLSWNSDWALEMHGTAQELGFMLIAGSSVSLCRRLPESDLPAEAKVRDGVVVFCGPDEAYGFHSLEFAQAVLEFRAGAEQGIRAVTVWRGPEAWRQLDQGRWSKDLMESAIEACRISSEGKRRTVQDGHYRETCDPTYQDFTVFHLEYMDGLNVTHVNLAQYLTSWGIALEVEGRESPFTAGPVMGEEPDHFGHFATLDRMIEEAFLSGWPVFAPERTLLTTCTTDAMMRARATPGIRLETPELAISYNPRDYPNPFPLKEDTSST
jgi:hypothetical protein